jgi:C1A family cysteine protease
MSRLRLIAGQMRHVGGWKPDTKDHRDYRLPPPIDPHAIPSLSDLRPHAPPIRDQQSIGSCVANGSLEAFGFLYTRDGKPDPLLSRLWAYALCRKGEGTPLAEDSGCQIRDMMSTLAAFGAPPENLYPYIEAKFSDEPPQDLYPIAAQHKALFYYRCPNLLTIKASISQGYPVVFGMSLPENFMSDECASTGIVKYPSAKEGFDGGHCMLALAFDDAKQRACAQNSWTDQWGDKGYCYIPYAMFTDGFVQDAWTMRKAML